MNMRTMPPAQRRRTVVRQVRKRLALSIFEAKYHNDETGRTAHAPKIVLKVVLLAYSRGLIASRKIEPACGTSGFRSWSGPMYPSAQSSGS